MKTTLASLLRGTPIRHPRLIPGSSLRAFAVFALGAMLAFTSLSAARGQGAYRAVSAADVTALRLNHYFSPDGKSHGADFEWSFTDGEFVLRKGAGAIPADLVGRLLASAEPAAEIRGRWKVEAGRLVLTALKAGGRTAKPEVIFPIHRTAPSVIRVGDPQYVFGVGR